MKPAFAYASVFVALAIGACTVFDGLVAAPVGGDGGLPDAQGTDAGPPPAGFLSLEDAARFCTNAIKCPYLGSSTIQSIDVPVDGLNYSSCINWLAGPLPSDRIGVPQAAAALRCAARATSCPQAGACMWDEVVAANDPRCQSGDGGRTCAEDGGAMYMCSAGFILHCTNPIYAAGTTCLVGTDKVPWCALGKNCNLSTQCKGNELDYCGANTNLTNGYDCTTSGLTCGFDTASSTYDCLTNGVLKNCTTVGVTCSGTSVDVCDGLYDSLYNCGAAAGGTCDSTALPRCKRPSDTCTPIDPGVNTCTGDVVSLCVGGKTTSLDCTTLGMKCVPGTGGASPHCQ